ncbi:hypothetical protein PV325_004179 [Microctonus aethiopoides]|uniref:Phosphatidic acid phosphatase type 2/haloperoxidase domain-containing protein n=1 Tax=Microctonus aethiopoides TaxID=144406 RepID=A0AA39FXN9_9HYME|nr:hypothetical protein PV325_004179 [Microctonus aethiopoides]KAK0087857.1 hypothetical protein PV326_005012 [Microctonus aethiopoides]KAK0177395.1 hypothetical protein PV328_001453 [Microctonus aethiopoides]
MDKKRQTPSLLKKILALDVYLTDQFVRIVDKFMPLRQLKVHNKVLEISAHGILWFAGWLALIWIISSTNLYQMQVNLYIGLLIDVIAVAIIKAITRRRRPAKNDDVFEIGPDKYSFPSGHASRSTFITYFFINLWNLPIIFILPLIAWSTSICISRLLMRRHHLLDVIAGVLLGILEGFFIGLIYLESETCIGLISWLTDEKLDGGEYHV